MMMTDTRCSSRKEEEEEEEDACRERMAPVCVLYYDEERDQVLLYCSVDCTHTGDEKSRSREKERERETSL